MLQFCLGYWFNLGPNLWFDGVNVDFMTLTMIVVINGDVWMAVAMILYRWRWVYDDVNGSETIEPPVPGWVNVYRVGVNWYERGWHFMGSIDISEFILSFV